MMNPATKTTLIRLGCVVAVYIALVFLAGHHGRGLMYPVRIFVTILHELGHAAGGIITGGKVEYVRINYDGSGRASVLGGNIPIIVMGGYVGSALFGNILFYIGVKAGKMARVTLYLIGAIMIFSALFWFSHLFSSISQIIFGLIAIGLAYKKWIMPEILMFLGIASLVYIIQDFNGGPSSDLALYAERVRFLSPKIWSYIWLGIVLILTAFNIRMIVRQDKPKKEKEKETAKPIA